MKKINTVLCSFGMSGKVFHAPFITLHPGFNLLGAWERSKEIIREFYPGAKSYKSFEEILSDDNVDLVIINTPNYTHYDYTKKALLAGKHVVVEKPFTTTVTEGEELKKLAAEKGKIISVYHNRRYDSDFKILQQVINDNLLGEVVEAEFHYDRFREEISAKAHKEVPGPGAGIVYDLGAHLIDQAIQLFGYPKAVFADIVVVRPTSKVDDYFELLFYYPHTRVRLKGSYMVREALPAYVIHGRKGSFIKSKADVQEEVLLAGGKPTDTPDWGLEPESEAGLLHTEIDGKIVKKKLPAPQGNYLGFYKDLYELLENNKPGPATADDGISVIKIIEAAFKSSNEKKAVEL